MPRLMEMTPPTVSKSIELFRRIDVYVIISFYEARSHEVALNRFYPSAVGFIIKDAGLRLVRGQPICF